MKRPNVLLIVADQFRGDCLGIDGHPDVKTPFLDTLAEQGARFTRAYTATPSCIAARAALFTGMEPRHHGRVGYQDRVRWDYENTLAGCFTAAGYQTRCVGKMHVYPLRSRQGFEEVELHDGFFHSFQNVQVPMYEHQLVADDYMHEMDGHGHRHVLDTGLECNGWVARPWPYEEKLHPTNWVADHTIDFLRRRDRDHPFFLMASFVRPHPPFDAPACYFVMYRGKQLTSPSVGDWAAPIGRRLQDSPAGIPDPELLSEAQVGYYACITHLDHQIGRIMQHLRMENERDTYVMFVSDHGELLGDHNLFRKSLPYEGSARVPLLLSGPGIAPGTVNDGVVELRDVMPTLLSGCGIEVPGTVDGMNALELLRGADWREWVHGEHTVGEGSVHFVVTSRDKYVWHSATGREQYFDLATDPAEQHDGIADAAYQSRIGVLRGKLVDDLAGREEHFVQDGQLVPGRPVRAVLQSALRGE